ncbi:flagellar basal body L-ring protein FlgH, partial [Sulfurospirillum sp. T05]
MKRYGVISLAVLPLMFAGCASHTADPRIDMTPPAYVEELPPRAPVSNLSNPGSLYGRGDNPLFSDRKAMNTNDIVTVVISESLTQTSNASKNISKENTDRLGGGI